MVREHVIAATVISLVGVLGVRQLRKDHAAAAPGADSSVAASDGFTGRNRGSGEPNSLLDSLGNLLAGTGPDKGTANTPLAVTGSAPGQAFNPDAPTQAQAAAGVQGAAPTDTVVNDQVTQPSSPTSPLQSTRGTLAFTPIALPLASAPAPAPAPSASPGADSLVPGAFAAKLGFTAPAPTPVRNTAGTGGLHTKAV